MRLLAERSDVDQFSLVTEISLGSLVLLVMRLLAELPGMYCSDVDYRLV